MAQQDPKTENLQKAITLVTAWVEHGDDSGRDLVAELVQSYAAEDGMLPMILGLLSLATGLVIQLQKARPELGTEQEILQQFAAKWASD